MITRFEIGKVYACRSTCDYDCIFSARVVARTEKTVTFEEEHRGRYTCRPHLWRDVESVYPHGRFSMCPVFSADRTLEQVINPPTRAQQEKSTMKTKPAATRGTVHAETGKPPVKASKPTAPATKAETVEKVIKARAAAIGIDPKKVFVGVVGAKPETKPQTAPAPAAKPAEKAKPADKPKPAQAPATPSDDETGRAWRDMAKRHAAEMAALGVAVSPQKGVPCLRFVSGLYVPVAKAADYRATVDRHREERAKMRDVPATARGVYREELRTFKGDEIAALYELGLPHIADKGGVAVPVIRGDRALAEAWRSALEEVAPGKVSQIVTVRALGKPKPQTAQAPAAKPVQAADKPKPPQAPAKPVTVEKPKGMGMVAKIEAKADAKPAKAKSKK